MLSLILSLPIQSNAMQSGQNMGAFNQQRGLININIPHPQMQMISNDFKSKDQTKVYSALLKLSKWILPMLRVSDSNKLLEKFNEFIEITGVKLEADTWNQVVTFAMNGPDVKNIIGVILHDVLNVDRGTIAIVFGMIDQLGVFTDLKDGIMNAAASIKTTVSSAVTDAWHWASGTKAKPKPKKSTYIAFDTKSNNKSHTIPAFTY